MALSDQVGAYADCYEYLDRALDDPKGIRFRLTDKIEGNAIHMNMRLQKARALHRSESRRIYPRDDPRYDKSPYDVLVCRKPRQDPEGYWWQYIEPHGTNVDLVESLSEEQDDAQAES